MGCFYHSKVEASSACRRCMIPICEDCTRERYCPECHKMAVYVRQGHSGPRQPNLVVEDNQRRASLTRQLMINRLAHNVLSEMQPEGSERRPDRQAARQGARKPASARRGPAPRQSKPVGAIAASVLALVAAFSLGTIFSRPPAQAAAGSETAGQVPADPYDVVAQGAGESAQEAPPQAAARAEIVYADVPRSELLPQNAALPRTQVRNETPDETRDRSFAQAQPVAVPALPAAPRGYVGQNGRAALQALAAQAQPQAVAPGEDALVPDLPTAPVAQPGAYAAHAAPAVVVARAEVRPSLTMSWPVAGNTLRMTSYLKVRVTNPGQVSVLNVTVDGRPFAPLQNVAARNEIPVDTTQIPNGDHRIQVMAMTESGDIITSDAVPVTVLN